MSQPFNIADALADDKLLGAALGSLQTWRTWAAVLKATFGLRLDRRERALFRQVAGNRKAPAKRVNELWCVCGRRSGKTRTAAALATYLALFVDYSKRLSPGETGYVLLIGPTVAQAKLAFSYIRAFIEESPILRQQLVSDPTADEIRLRGGIVISVHPASFRSVRGRTVLAAILDEVSFWADEDAALSDREALRALVPSLATTSGLIVGISSPYRKTGVLYDKHKRHFGQDGDVLVVQGPTLIFNPTIDKRVIEASERDDMESARAEWHAEFRSDLSSLFDEDVIESAIDRDRPLELPPRGGVAYHAFCDMSGGRHDAAVLCIGHGANGNFIADVVRAVEPPFNPATTAKEFSELAKSYGARTVTGDNYSAEWVASAFRDCGIDYQLSPLNKSQLYLEALALWNQGRVRIPDDAALLRELRGLERRTSRSGRDSVDHGRNDHDDRANAVCGALFLAVEADSPKGEVRVGSYSCVAGPYSRIQWHDRKTSQRRELQIVNVDEVGRRLSDEEVLRRRRDQNLLFTM